MYIDIQYDIHILDDITGVILSTLGEADLPEMASFKSPGQ
jgi:hypothetical protein